MPHLSTLPTLIRLTSPLLLLGTSGFWLESGSGMGLWRHAPSPRMPSPCCLGLPPKTTWPAPFEGSFCGLHSWYKVLDLPHQGIYLVFLIFELLWQLILLGGGYCGCCHLGFAFCFCLTNLPFCILQGNACNRGKGLQSNILHYPRYSFYNCGTDDPLGAPVPLGVGVNLATCL